MLENFSSRNAANKRTNTDKNITVRQEDDVFASVRPFVR